MPDPNALEDATLLADFQTDTKGAKALHDVTGEPIAWLYAVGWSNDTFDLEYRPNENRAWATVRSGLSSGVKTINFLPEGEYRITRSGNNDNATVALI